MFHYALCDTLCIIRQKIKRKYIRQSEQRYNVEPQGSRGITNEGHVFEESKFSPNL